MMKFRHGGKHLMKEGYPRRALALLLCLCMAASCFGGVTAFAADDGLAFSGSGDYTINDDGTIVINSGEVDLMIENVTITATDSPAIYVKAGATLNLKVEGDNTLTGGKGCAAICVEPAYADDPWSYLPDSSAKLNISGSGTLTATGGMGSNNYGGGAGIGGNGENFDGDYGGVDIGTINITEGFKGKIIANGGNANNKYSFGAGAGIGCGGSEEDWGEVYGRITIRNGTIIAEGGSEPTGSSEAGAPGIGGSGVAGGYTVLSYMTVEISGGDITAIGNDAAAGIGGGNDCNSGTILISGGYVRALHRDSNSFFCGAAIGGGDNAAANYIEITGGTVIADSSNRSGAGIGHGNHAAFGILEEGQETIYIKISGEDTVVYAYGGTCANSRNNTVGSAGIGLGASQWANDYDHDTIISITDGATVYAYGGYHAQAIGYCYYYTDKNLYTGQGFKLEMDDSITLWAVNTDYNYPALVAYENRLEETVDVSHSNYVSTERYLITYTNEAGEGKNDTKDIASGSAKGSLTAPDDFATEYPRDAELTWTLDGDQMKMEFTDPRVNDIEPLFYPFTGENQVGSSPLHGNWATMYPPIVHVEYEFVGDAPKGVDPPDEEYIAKGDEYTAKDQDTSAANGWTFDGWYTDAACTEKFVDGTKLDKNTTLYGKWTEPKPVGDLTITKVVAGDAPKTDTDGKGYTFTITGPADAAEQTYELDNGESITFSDGTAPTTDVTIKGAGSVTIKDLPVGTYTVTEDGDGAAIKGYELEVNVEGDADVTDGGTATVTVTNTYTISDPGPGPSTDPNPGPSTDPDPGPSTDPGPGPWPDRPIPSKPPEELNTWDHFAYIIGDDNGLVRPLGEITRAEVVTIFFRLLTDEARNQYWATTNPYPDVNKDDWYNNAISTLTNMGIVNGLPGGTFGPTLSITRAEFVKIAVGFFDYADREFTGSSFSDIAGNWAERFINAAAELGLVNGYPDGTFRPSANISRSEAMAIVNRVLGRKPHVDGLYENMIYWPDNMDTSKWYYADVQEATNSHEYEMSLYKHVSCTCQLEDCVCVPGSTCVVCMMEGCDQCEFTYDQVYENWTARLPVRDWAAFEKAWSDANSASNPGEVMG